jgi:hypothetical protein
MGFSSISVFSESIAARDVQREAGGGVVVMMGIRALGLGRKDGFAMNFR